MSSWGSYTSIYNFGHRAITDLLKGPVLVEEKIDGSQFSFGIFNRDNPVCNGIWDECFELKVRSKGATMIVDAPEKMFTEAVETVKAIRGNLIVGWTYRGEYLKKPKHNALAYDRIPNGHIIIFDINTDEETYLSYAEKKAEAERLGLEIVPLLFEGIIRERGEIEDDVRDIGKLMKEIPEDIKIECEAEIKERLFAWAWPNIRRIVTRGVPEYYKDSLLRKQFEGDSHVV